MPCHHQTFPEVRRDYRRLTVPHGQTNAPTIPPTKLTPSSPKTTSVGHAIATVGQVSRTEQRRHQYRLRGGPVPLRYIDQGTSVINLSNVE